MNVLNPITKMTKFYTSYSDKKSQLTNINQKIDEDLSNWEQTAKEIFAELPETREAKAESIGKLFTAATNLQEAAQAFKNTGSKLNTLALKLSKFGLTFLTKLKYYKESFAPESVSAKDVDESVRKEIVRTKEFIEKADKETSPFNSKQGSNYPEQGGSVDIPSFRG